MLKIEFVDQLINVDPEFATRFEALTASQQKGMIRMVMLIANAFDSFADFELIVQSLDNRAELTHEKV